MDFLTKMYSNENFGIILFAVISILVLVFLIILFFGKKDQKERKLAQTNQIDLEKNQNCNNEIDAQILENNHSEVAFQETAPFTTLEIGNTIKNVEPEISSIATPNLVLNEELESPMNSQNFGNANEVATPMAPTLEPEPTVPTLDFDFDALASSISKELESIGVETDDLDEPKPVIKPSIQENALNTLVAETTKKEEQINPNPIVFESVKQPEPIVEIPIEEKTTKPIIEEKPKMPRPTQFSSVFVTKKKEETENIPPVTKNEEITPEPVPVKPTFELPKTIDLPKLNTDNNIAPTPVIEEKKPDIVFPSLENDIPAYPKNDENRM